MLWVHRQKNVVLFVFFLSSWLRNFVGTILFVFFCLCAFVQIVVYVVGKFVMKWERPYQHDSTASRLLSEVKHARAQLVLRWGTTLES